jgi:hypothetical protein
MTTTIGTDTLAGTVSLPTGYSVSSKSVGIQTSDGGSISLFTDGSTSTSFTYNLPAISGAKAVVGVVATDPSGAFIEYQSDAKATNAKGVSISIPTAVTQSLPVTGATNVKAGQVFSWNPLSQGLNLVIFTGPAGQPRVTVITTAASDTLPSLSAVGLSYPTAANYTWLVGALAPFSNTDAMAGSSTFTKFTVLSETAARTFTTAP